MSGNASSLVNIFANKMQALQVSRTQRVTVALSGGPDSLALALLAAWWGNTTGRPPSEDVKIALEQTAFASHHINMRHEEQEQFPNNLVNNVRSFMRPGGRVQLGRAKDSDRPTPLRKGITQEMMNDPQRRPVEITALIVDHALRDESSQEAEKAKELANALGLQPMVMRVDWRRKHPKQGQMLEAARNARYELMLDACRKLGAKTLLTAHHAGDQVENFLIRLSRASGVDGLATIPEMATMTTAHGNYKVRVLRPLLGIHKEQLLELCQANEVQWVEDPTNKNLSFTRNFIRDLLEQHGSYEQMQEASLGRLDLEFETSGPRAKQPEIFGAQEGGVPTVLDDVLRLQGSCTDARNEFGERAAAVLREAVVSGRGNIAHLPVLQINGCLVDVAPIAATDPGTAQRAIGAILQAIAGRPYPPNLRSTRGLWNIIKSGNMRGSFQGGGCHAREVPIPGAARTTLMWVAPISSS
ncbi:hypothetical protein WJX84_005914 [Apatococcus fuscideae]|uniref:tRNA(Ile)-lysidine synthetase n=1 Tax=Apatococcus fuscideae TaxID=2026836 RepID=A0AAW1SNJ2_9CHLO